MGCSECGGRLVEDNHGAEKTLVCFECGQIVAAPVNDDFECTEPYFVREEKECHAQQLENRFQRNMDDPSLTYKKRLAKYIPILERAAGLFTRDPNVVKDAFQLFSQLCIGYYYGKRHVTKVQVAGACLYIACRERDVPVTADKVCCALQSPKRGFAKILSKVHEETGKKVGFVNFVEGTIAQLPAFKNKPDLVKKAIKIFELFQACSLCDGPMRNTIVCAVAYFTVVSEEIASKICTPYNKFCKDNDLKLTTNTLVLEFKKKLIVLVKRLPWNNPNRVRVRSFHVYINDVVKNKDGLLALDACSDAESPDDYLNFDPGEEGHSTGDTGESSTVMSSLLKGEHDMKEHGLSLKQYLDLNPSFVRSGCKRRRSRSPERNLVVSRSETLDENDIPDNELGKYLRSPDEVESALKIRKLLLQKAQSDK